MWSGYAHPRISLYPQSGGNEGVGKMRKWLWFFYNAMRWLVVFYIILSILTIEVK